MAKIAKSKSQPKSVHSRAARRAVSPSLDVDKSITSLPRPESTTPSVPAVLGAQHNSGVSKKNKSKQKTRTQKRRQEKGMERAEVVMDKTEKKVTKSVQRGKRVKARRATWEDLYGPKRGSGDQNVDTMDTSEHEAQSASPVPAPASAPVRFDPTTAMPESDQVPDQEEEDEIT